MASQCSESQRAASPEGLARGIADAAGEAACLARPQGVLVQDLADGLANLGDSAGLVPNHDVPRGGRGE
eukprot:10533278-Heterocapsa_arctica.AAC.1